MQVWEFLLLVGLAGAAAWMEGQWFDNKGA